MPSSKKFIGTKLNVKDLVAEQPCKTTIVCNWGTLYDRNAHAPDYAIVEDSDEVEPPIHDSPGVSENCINRCCDPTQVTYPAEGCAWLQSRLKDSVTECASLQCQLNDVVADRDRLLDLKSELQARVAQGKNQLAKNAWLRMIQLLQHKAHLYDIETIHNKELMKMEKRLQSRELMLEKERERLDAQYKEQLNLEIELEEAREEARGKTAPKREKALTEFRRLKAESLGLEQKTASLRKEAASLTEEVAKLEKLHSKLLTCSKTDMKKIVACEKVLSDILRKPLLEDTICLVCGGVDKLSVHCDSCASSTCISCMEENLTVQFNSGSIEQKRQATALKCFSCPKRHNPMLAALFSHETRNLYFELKTELAYFDSEQSRNMKTERANKLQELATQSGHEKLLWVERMIVKELRTLKCPSCLSPFESFTGCCALSCAGCNAHFCAWCLSVSKSSREAHIHVQTCEHNPCPGDYFAPLDLWQEIMDRSLNSQVRKYIEGLEKEISDQLLKEFKWLLQ